MSERTLLLTSWYLPHRVVRWQDAVIMLCLGKAERVIDYADEIRSPSVTMRMPAVVRLRRKVRKVNRSVRFSRTNVFIRDGFRCQYCGQKQPISRLTFDHVQPRSCGGRTEWTNIVAACRPCNGRKGNQTPDEAGMFPRKRPRRPLSLPLTGPLIDAAAAPREWHDFLVVSA